MEKPKIAEKNPFTDRLTAGTYYWCACGISKTQPFCDGSHKNTSFLPKKMELSKNKSVSLCQCKQTSYPPDCDGTHRKL